MRRMLILLALASLTVNSGCSRCRNLFRRGSPCGGTALAAPAMLGGAIPLGSPMSFQQAPQTVIAQPGCCQQAVPLCDPCPSNCVPCESGGYISGDSGYVGEVGGDCGCQPGSGVFFGDYVGDNVPPMADSVAVPDGSGTVYPEPVSGN